MSVALALALTGGGIAWAQVAPTATIFFDSESFALDDQQASRLDALAPHLREAREIRIDGYVQRSREGDTHKGPAHPDVGC